MPYNPFMSPRCFICEIIEAKEDVRVVRDTEDIIAYRSPLPLAPVHIVIAPKKHMPSLTALKPEDCDLLARLFLLVPELARENAIYQCGFRLVAGCGPDADVEPENSHVHFHMLGGTRLTDRLA